MVKRTKSRLEQFNGAVAHDGNAMKTLVLIALLITVCTNVIADDKSKKEKICITEQEFEVYEAVGILNYYKETSNYPFSESVETQMPNASPDVVADYKDKNSKSYLLRCVLRRDLKKKKLQASVGGTWSFSRIGFNRGETEALIYASWEGRGNMCGSDFYYLRKENNQWKILKKVMMVIC